MKAQGATEWLQTYTPIILIIVVVGAVLFSLGVFDPRSFVSERTDEWECAEWGEPCDTNREFYICTGKCLAHTEINTSWDDIRDECYPPCKYLLQCSCVKEQLTRRPQ